MTELQCIVDKAADGGYVARGVQAAARPPALAGSAIAPYRHRILDRARLKFLSIGRYFQNWRLGFETRGARTFGGIHEGNSWTQNTSLTHKNFWRVNGGHEIDEFDAMRVNVGAQLTISPSDQRRLREHGRALGASQPCASVLRHRRHERVHRFAVGASDGPRRHFATPRRPTYGALDFPSGFAFFLGDCAKALPAAFRPRGDVLLADRAFPAALAATVPVVAARPVCESALPAAVCAAFVAFGLFNTRAAAVAAFAPVLRTAMIASGMVVNETATIRYAMHGQSHKRTESARAGLRWRRLE